MTAQEREHSNGAYPTRELAGREAVRVNGSVTRQDIIEREPDAEVEALVKSLRDRVIRKPETSWNVAGSGRQDLAEVVGDFIFVIDLSGRLDYINRAAAHFLGVPSEQVVGQSYEVLGLMPEDQAEELLVRVITREEVVRYEVTVPQGVNTTYFYGTLSPMRDPGGCITGILGIARDISEIARAREELRSLSLVDELTGVYNRRGFVSLAAQLLSLATRNGSRVCLVMADMDRLKAINDGFGHPQGDAALSALAAILKTNCRQSDVVARIGGDEFVLLASGVSDGGTELLVDRLREAVAAENSLRPYNFSASIGAVERGPEDSSSIEMLLEEADRMMYKVKRQNSRY